MIWTGPATAVLFCLALLGAFAATAAVADADLRTDCKAHFATAEEAADILGQKDDFVQRLSAFDRAARLKTDGEVSESQFLAFVRASVSSWTDAERTRIEAAIAAIRPALQRIPVPFPKIITFIKTSGAEEGHAFYTRDTGIVMPATELGAADKSLLTRTIAHETFHILSRTNPKLRERLYAAIGFTSCAEAELPTALRARKITNPDAPRNDHCIRLRVAERNVAAIPLLLSKTEKYDPAKGGEFFNYLELKFLVIGAPARVSGDLVNPTQVSGLFEQIGHNTDYIIHPEEILADNFALLIAGRKDVPSPEILAKIGRVINQP